MEAELQSTKAALHALRVSRSTSSSASGSESGGGATLPGHAALTAAAAGAVDGSTDEDWAMRFELFKLLKRKTEVTSEARKIVECVGDSNGYEVWRLLGVRYEPQVGMKRLKELGELTMLQNKRCKTTA